HSIAMLICAVLCTQISFPEPPSVCACLLQCAESNMSTEVKTTRPILCIPGPCEYSEDVLKIVGESSLGHTGAQFLGNSLYLVRHLCFRSLVFALRPSRLKT